MNKHWKKQELWALREFYRVFTTLSCRVLTLDSQLWGRTEECKDVCDPESRAVCKLAAEVAWIRERKQQKALRKSERANAGKRS
jgi:hypothetical protein